MNGLGNNTPTISEIQTVVASMHGCTKADIIGKGRKRHESTPRMEAAALARELTGHSLPLLGKHFGGRDHTTILYSCRKVADRALSDPKLAARLDECRAQLAVIVAKRAGRMVVQASSSDWSPPPPHLPSMAMTKPSTVIASINGAAWLACAA